MLSTVKVASAMAYIKICETVHSLLSKEKASIEDLKLYPSVLKNHFICIMYLAQNLKVASTGFNHVIFLRILCKYVLSIAQAKRHASCYVLISITCARPFIFSFTQQQAVYF